MVLLTNGFGVPNKQITGGLGISNVILHYLSEQEINTNCISEVYSTSRECIFSRGGFIKDKPLVKLLMMICDYLKSRYYVKNNEVFIDKIEGIFKKKVGKLWFIEVTSALMSRITNYFQAKKGYIEEPSENIKIDIYKIINEMIYRNQKDVVAYIDIVLQEEKYSVGLSICHIMH